MVSASPTAEIEDTQLESSNGTSMVSGDDEKIQQNNKNDNQDKNENVKQAEVVRDKLDAAIKEVIISQDKRAITFEDIEMIIEYVDKKLMDGLPQADLAKSTKSPVQRKFIILSAKKGTKRNAIKEKEKNICQLDDQEARDSTGTLRSLL